MWGKNDQGVALNGCGRCSICPNKTKDGLGLFQILVDTLAGIIKEDKEAVGFESDVFKLRAECSGAYSAIAYILAKCPSQKGQTSEKCMKTMKKIYNEFHCDRDDDCDDGEDSYSLVEKMRRALKKHL